MTENQKTCADCFYSEFDEMTGHVCVNASSDSSAEKLLKELWGAK